MKDMNSDTLQLFTHSFLQLPLSTHITKQQLTGKKKHGDGQSFRLLF